MSARGPGTALSLLDGLDAGASLELAPAARVVVSFPGPHGEVYDLAGPGRFGVGAHTVRALAAATGEHPAVARRPLPAALQALPVTAARAVQASVTLRGEQASTLAPLGPTGRQLPEAARRLRWTPEEELAGGAAPGYRVRLIDDEGRVAFETVTQVPAAEVPATVALERGRPYVWTVAAFGPYGSGRSIAAEFVVVDEATQRCVEAAGAATGGRPADQVLVALALEQFGLAQEAAAAWRRLAALRAAEPRLALRAR